MHTRIKICGITSLDIALDAVDAGVDALGFNMFESSSRYIGIEDTKEILNALPSSVIKVGLFVNHGYKEVRSAIEHCPFDLLQFHGSEDNNFCDSFPLPFLKAIPFVSKDETQVEFERYPDSIGILVDSAVTGKFGGTGISFDWASVPSSEMPIWLAGGLCAENVASAMEIARPYAVDVSSGVESSPGIKNSEMIRKFVKVVRDTDNLKGV